MRRDTLGPARSRYYVFPTGAALKCRCFSSVPCGDSGTAALDPPMDRSHRWFILILTAHLRPPAFRRSKLRLYGAGMPFREIRDAAITAPPLRASRSTLRKKTHRVGTHPWVVASSHKPAAR